MAETETVSEEKIKTLSRWLFNPFYYIAGVKSLIIGLIAILITEILAYKGNSHFNGVIDFHFGLVSSCWINISELIISWLLIGLLLLITGKIISKSRIRIIDVFGTQALARFPDLFIALAAMIPGSSRFAENLASSLIQNHGVLPAIPFSVNMAAFIFTMIIIIAMTIWIVALMYRAFAMSFNVVGKKAAICFTIALFLGEIISIIIFSQLLKSQSNQIPVAAQASDLAAQASNFVTMLSDADYKTAESMFDETMKTGLPEEKLKEAWESLAAQSGHFQAQGLIRKTEIQGYDVIFVPCEFERASLDCQIAFDTKGMIAGLYFRPSSNK
jgi:hypothetical protein